MLMMARRMREALQHQPQSILSYDIESERLLVLQSLVSARRRSVALFQGCQRAMPAIEPFNAWATKAGLGLSWREYEDQAHRACPDRSKRNRSQEGGTTGRTRCQTRLNL